ncbi:MAG: hypothetical protein RL059_517 [Bacteroidota bacterium]
MLDLSIIIVNYKTPSITVDCIESIYKQNSTLNFEIIVVDNDSQDNSETFVTEKFSEVIWINNHSNEGFGRANNIGIKKSKGEFILLLNSDTIIIDNAIQTALSRLKSDTFSKLERNRVRACTDSKDHVYVFAQTRLRLLSSYIR